MQTSNKTNMDNQIFDVNGETKEQLLKTIELALLIPYKRSLNGWEFDPKKGFILSTYGDKMNKFPVAVSAEIITDMVWDWLQTDEAKNVPARDSWDTDYDHDGHNDKGWRAYLEEWGHIGDRWGAILCVKPCYLWYGK